MEWGQGKKVFQIDTETTGDDFDPNAVIQSLQIGQGDTQWVLDWQSISPSHRIEVLDMISNYEVLKILQNSKFDLKFFLKEGIQLYPVYDTMLTEIVLFTGKKLPDVWIEGDKYGSYSLPALVKRYTGNSMSKEVRGLIKSKGFIISVIHYAAGDVKYLETIMRKQLEVMGNFTPTLEPVDEFTHLYEIYKDYVEYCDIRT